MSTKARYSEPCNRCGICCAMELCPAAESAFPAGSAPCPALCFNAGEAAACGLVMMEDELGVSVVKKMLGIGCGCSCPDDDTTAAQIQEFDRMAYVQMFGDGQPTLAEMVNLAKANGAKEGK